MCDSVGHFRAPRELIAHFAGSLSVISLLAPCCAAQTVQAETRTATDLYTLNAPIAGRTFAARSACGGQIVGDAWTYAAVWNGGSGTVLYNNASSTAVATDGVHQVGYTKGVASRAKLWTGTSGSTVDLHPSALTSSCATGVRGTQQVGYGSGTSTDNNNHALLWKGTAESVVDLHPSGYTASQANATDGSRQAGSGVRDGQTRALLWDGSADSAVDLHPAGFSSSSISGIWGSQQVGGGYPLYTSMSHALLWNGTVASAVDLNPAGFDSSVAVGTNGRQQIGYGSFSATALNHAMLWTGSAGSFVDLHALLPAGYRSSFAYSIDSAGIIYGVAYAEDGSVHAIMWTPEPTCLTLLAIGGACLLGRRRNDRF